ncbi:hypothetical protein [Campylobacter iguaniorum]|uniref:hypothetical protein n=1 Tax=Campylobacter iguaniorum TaxID=1244531 RepID=UPI0007C88514|nr:hypothetical protein [Campylobacter iguaniorum]
MRTLLLLCAFFTWIFADAHIFIYHRFDDARHPSISSQALRNQFNYFKQNGYKVVKLDEIIKKVASKYLKAEFIEPKVYPKDGNLAKIIARIDTNSSKVSLYISGLGSKEVEVKNGIIEVDIDQKITKDRVGIIINDKLKTATQIITKDKNAK